MKSAHRTMSPPVTKPQLRECPGCGQFQIVPALGPDMRSNCVRCGTALRLTRADPLNRHLALTFAALVLFAVLWLAMLMKVSTAGIVHETTLESGPIELVNRGLWPLALAVAFTTAIAPLIKFAGTVYVLVGLKMRWLPPNLRGVFLVARRMGTWAMLEVLLLGVFVAYTKLGDLVTKTRQGKDFMKVEEGISVQKPCFMIGNANFVAALSSDARLLVFPLEEVPVRPNGGVGVQLIALPEKISLAAVAVTDGKSLVVSGVKRKNRAVETLDAKQLAGHMGKRAQRGKVCDAGFRPDRLGE